MPEASEPPTDLALPLGAERLVARVVRRRRSGRRSRSAAPCVALPMMVRRRASATGSFRASSAALAVPGRAVRRAVPGSSTSRNHRTGSTARCTRPLVARVTASGPAPGRSLAACRSRRIRRLDAGRARTLHAGVLAVADGGAGRQQRPQRIVVVLGAQRQRLGRPAATARRRPAQRRRRESGRRSSPVTTVQAGQAARTAASTLPGGTVPGTHSRMVRVRPVQVYSQPTCGVP